MIVFARTFTKENAFFSIFPKIKDLSVTERPDSIPFLHNADEHNMFAKVALNKNSV